MSARRCPEYVANVRLIDLDMLYVRVGLCIIVSFLMGLGHCVDTRDRSYLLRFLELQ